MENKNENDKLIMLLSKEPDLNNWLKAVFSENTKSFYEVISSSEENQDKAKGSLIVWNGETSKEEDKNQITTLDDLVSKMSKADAIRSFIEESRDCKRLKKRYQGLLNNQNLLNQVVLEQGTVEWCLDRISNCVEDKKLEFSEEKLGEVKNSLESWNTGLEKEKKIGINLLNK